MNILSLQNIKHDFNNTLLILLLITITFVAVCCNESIIQSIYAQTDFSQSGDNDTSNVEAVTSTVDSIVKSILLIAQTTIVGSVFSHIILKTKLSKLIAITRRSIRIKNNYSSNGYYVGNDNVPIKNQTLNIKRFSLIIFFSSISILITSTLLIFFQANSLSNELDLDLSVTFDIILSTSVGEVWIIRIITSFVILISIFFYYYFSIKKFKKSQDDNDISLSSNKNRFLFLFKNPSILLYILLFFGATSIFSNSMVSHNSAISFFPLFAISVDWIHFMAVSIWIGGLFYVSVILLNIKSITMRENNNFTSTIGKTIDNMKIINTLYIAISLSYFSTIASFSLCIIGITGLYMAWIHIQSLELVTTSAYGVILLIKLGSASPMVFIGLYHQIKTHDILKKLNNIGQNKQEEGEEKEKDFDILSSSKNLGKDNNIDANIDYFKTFRKTIKIESLIGIVVLTVASFLTLTSPPSLATADSNPFDNTLQQNKDNTINYSGSFLLLIILLSITIVSLGALNFVINRKKIRNSINSLLI